MFRRLTHYFKRFVDHPCAIYILAFLAFIESSFCPILPDILFIPLILRNPQKAWLYTAVCVVSSLLGGLLGYALGYWLFETIGKSLLSFYHAERALASLDHFLDHYGKAALLIGALTPLPYKIISITSGMAHLHLPLFVAASLIGRTIRFSIIVFVARFCRPYLVTFFQKRFGNFSP